MAGDDGERVLGDVDRHVLPGHENLTGGRAVSGGGRFERVDRERPERNQILGVGAGAVGHVEPDRAVLLLITTDAFGAGDAVGTPHDAVHRTGGRREVDVQRDGFPVVHDLARPDAGEPVLLRAGRRDDERPFGERIAAGEARDAELACRSGR